MPEQLAFYLEKGKTRTLLHIIHKIDSRVIKELNIKKKKEKLSNLRRKYIYDILVDKVFINMTKKMYSHKRKY